MTKDEFSTRYDTTFGVLTSDKIDCKFPGPKDDPTEKELDDLEANIKTL